MKVTVFHFLCLVIGFLKEAEETVDWLNDLLELSSQSDIRIDVKKVERRGLMIVKEFFMSDFDIFEGQVIDKKKLKNNIEDMVYWIELTYNDFVDIPNINFITPKTTGHTLLPGIYEIRDLNSMLESLFQRRWKQILQLTLLDNGHI